MANNDELRNNLFSFRDAFKDYTDCYTVIGGIACFILMDDSFEPKDININRTKAEMVDILRYIYL